MTLHQAWSAAAMRSSASRSTPAHRATCHCSMVNMPLQAIKAALGAPPFFKEEDGQAQQNGASEEGSKAEGSATAAKAQQASHRPAVLADGSYASQTALTDTFTMPSMASNSPLNLRWVQSPQRYQQVWCGVLVMCTAIGRHMSPESGWCDMLCLVAPALQASRGILHMQHVWRAGAGGCC